MVCLDYRKGVGSTQSKHLKHNSSPVRIVKPKKEVLAEPVEKLRGKLELKATLASLGEASQRPELRPS